MTRKFQSSTIQFANPERGSVLLEVVLALALFVAAATVVSSGLRAAVSAAERLRYETHTENLAITVLSELQMGLRPLEAGAAQQFLPPFEDYTYELVIGNASDQSSASASPLTGVEVIVRHTPSGTTRRLSQLIRPAQLVIQTDTNNLEKAKEPEKPSGSMEEDLF